MTRIVAFAALLLACSGEPAEPQPTETTGDESPRWTGALDEDAFAALHELSGAEAPPLQGETIALGDGEAYLSLPEGEGPHPAILVIHEWWGLNDHIRHWADRLAEAGYVALAVDLYGGETATTPDEAMALMQAVDEDAALATMRAGHEYLGTEVGATKRGVVGWCFGGGMSLKAALNLEGLDAVVMYYGHIVDDPEQLRQIDAPLLGIFANQDTSITPEHVDAFDAALTTAEVEHTIHRYDANHAFANPSSARYDHENAADAWAKVQAFFAERLR
ncbi:MAG: dienelactone hydrolase family protein [Deltaproteobacteria bacterium]|nr:dienelactone hydrolase family protein [Deltaproteobacteria bacterium]